MQLRVDSFCKVLDLERGSKVIAILGLIWVVLSLWGIFFNGVDMIYLTGVIPYLVVSLLLLYGVRIKRPSFLKAWIAMKSVETFFGVCTVVMAAGLAVYVKMYQQEADTPEGAYSKEGKLNFLWIVGLFSAVFTAFGSYFLVVVYSHYKQMKAELTEDEKECLTKDT